MTLIPGIKQISQVGNNMYIQGAFPVSVANTDVSYLADPADTRLLAGRDPVIEEVSVGMSGVETGIKTASGAAPLQITDAMQGMLRFLETNIKPVQDLHGYANPWPAGGGKNKLDDTTMYVYSNWSSTACAYGDYNSNDTNKVFKIPVESGQEYTLSLGISANSFPTFLSLIKANGVDTTSLIARFTTDSYTRNAYTITTESGWDYYLRMGSTGSSEAFETQIGKASYGQLELGSSASSYAPYSNVCPITGWTGCNVYVSPTTNQADATVYPCTWQDAAGTVYGGFVDVVSGNGSGTLVSIQITSDMVSFPINTYTNIQYAKITKPADAIDRGHATTNVMCSEFAPDSTTVNWNTSDKVGGVFGGATFTDYWFGFPAGTTLAEAKAVLTGVQLVYKLNIPNPFAFQGVKINTLDGTNYIWTDCGDTITAAYVAVK